MPTPFVTAAESTTEAVVRERLRRQRLKTSPATKGSAKSAESDTQAELVSQLAFEVRQLESARGPGQPSAGDATSTGCTALDECLPHGGYVPGSVIEYLRSVPACGASYLALAAAAAALQAKGGFLVVVDTQHCIYPPALVAQGIDLKRVVWVRPDSRSDALWAVDQALRNPAVSAVFAELHSIDDRTARRMQLAAEAGSGLALLVRRLAARNAPSWAEVQWLVRPRQTHPSQPTRPIKFCSPSLSEPRTPLTTRPELAEQNAFAGRRFQVQLLRNRGGRAGARLQLSTNPVTGAIQRERNRHEKTATVRLASELASTKSASRRAATG